SPSSPPSAPPVAASAPPPTSAPRICPPATPPMAPLRSLGSWLIAACLNAAPTACPPTTPPITCVMIGRRASTFVPSLKERRSRALRVGENACFQAKSKRSGPSPVENGGQPPSGKRSFAWETLFRGLRLLRLNLGRIVFHQR